MTTDPSQDQAPITWGLVATIKAPVEEILAFAAYHLDLGAHRLFIFLDDDNQAAYAALKAHPKIRVTLCDSAYWKRTVGRRPGKHQVRQSANATHAYTNMADVDWLIHMDVDEFLWSETPLAETLGGIAPDVPSARIRPIESLAGDRTVFKAFIPADGNRNAIVQRVYPTYGQYVKGGFIGHVQGKIIARTGLRDLEFRIHSVLTDGVKNPDQIELDTVDLCHCHAKDWDHWIGHFHFRLEKGCYRPGLAKSSGGLTMNELLSAINADDGIEGLRAFYDEMCADTPALRHRLEKEGLLKIRDLGLGGNIGKHFTGY